jgi:hypothetical protein
MNSPIVAPYGSWRSPLTAEAIIAGTIGLFEGPIILDGDDIYWNEARPDEQGRSVVVRRTQKGRRVAVNQAPLNARSRVHEYRGVPTRDTASRSSAPFNRDTM